MALFLALYSGLAPSAFSGRPLTVTLLYGVRTFLPPTHYAPASDCLACFTGALYRAGRVCLKKKRTGEVHVQRHLWGTPVQHIDKIGTAGIASRRDI